MRPKFFIIPAIFILQTMRAQDFAPLAISETTVTPASATNTLATFKPSSASGLTEISIMDYKSVYEAATLEEEVQMATERFNLTKPQQEAWATAAVDRRETEKQTRAKLESKTNDYSKDAVYRGLRSAQNQFYETITGYFDPSQKQLLEKDRIIIEEKRKMIAKLPPPVIAPTVTVAPVDSTAIKAEMEKNKKIKAKSKKKKKPIGT
jgi:hypothetical protein